MKFWGRREWALCMAFVLCMVFLYIMQFLTSFYASPEKMRLAQVSNITGSIAGALFLPFILPLGALRQGSNQRFARPPRYFQRLILLGLLFLPNIVLLILGFNSWLTSPVNVVIRGVTNGVIMALVHGLFISLSSKNRNLWAGSSISIGMFVYNLVLTIQQRYQSAFAASFLFFIAGLCMVIIAVFLYLYLSAPPSASPAHAPGGAEDSPVPSGPSATPRPPKKRFPAFLFPFLAVAVIFWTNSFTEGFFMPGFYLPSGFHFTIVTITLALPALGFLADRDRQRFFRFFIPVSFGVFLLAPSLLLFSRSEALFLVLYTMNAVSIQLIVAVFPFAVLDLYWKESRPDGYWAWLLAISMNLVRVLAGARIGLFSSIPVDNPYAVLLLSLAVIVYFLLSRKLIKLQADEAGADTSDSNGANPVPPFAPPEDSFRAHGLSKRETEIASLILLGQTNRQIAERICVQEDTVKKHINSIFDKYKVKRRPEFMARVLNK
jgi:DNA-binding CsgD family transcriptional regulator